MVDDVFKQLGITKTSADDKIGNSILGGSVDLYGVKNAKNIALGNRKAVILNLIAHTKQYVNSAAFIKKYNAEIRDRYRPKEFIPQTPEEMRAAGIKAAKEAVVQMEETVKKADVNTKPIFQKVLDDAKKNVVFAEDPNNKHIVAYTKNYPEFVKSTKENYERQLADFERKYPANQLLYVKMRLQEFMDETKDIDFGAELVTKNGKKYFVNKAYENKGSRWKMAFRAGREVVEPAREAVQKWIDEIK